MNTRESIYKAYDDAADSYAEKFWDEIEKKNLDCILLRWVAGQVPASERILEIGSGPGEVSGYLSRHHEGCIATDQSEQMIRAGRRYFPKVVFEVQDFFHLSYADNSFPAVVAFYAIVNLTRDEIERAFHEVKRVLRRGGIFLFTFHVRKTRGTLAVRKFLEKDNRLEFYLYKVEEIRKLVEQAGLETVDIITRYPYPAIEYPTSRAYFITRKPVD